MSLLCSKPSSDCHFTHNKTSISLSPSLFPHLGNCNILQAAILLCPDFDLPVSFNKASLYETLFLSPRFITHNPYLLSFQVKTPLALKALHSLL